MRKTYAAARLDAACFGIDVPNLDPLPCAFNEFVTRQGPPATTGTSSSHAAEIEVAQA